MKNRGTGTKKVPRYCPPLFPPIAPLDDGLDIAILCWRYSSSAFKAYVRSN